MTSKMNATEAKEQFTQWLEAKFYSKGTIESYVACIPNFFGFLKSHPDIVGQSHSKRVEAYLSWRVVEGDIAPSTQNVELTALVQFHRMLGIELTGVNAIRAKRRDRIPPIMP